MSCFVLYNKSLSSNSTGQWFHLVTAGMQPTFQTLRQFTKRFDKRKIFRRPKSFNNNCTLYPGLCLKNCILLDKVSGFENSLEMCNRKKFAI